MSNFRGNLVTLMTYICVNGGMLSVRDYDRATIIGSPILIMWNGLSTRSAIIRPR